MAKKTQKPGQEENRRFTDVQTDKRIHEHLTNESDEISEQDISNVKTDASIAGENDETAILPAIETSEEERFLENETIKDNSDNDIETSWNILDP